MRSFLYSVIAFFCNISLIAAQQTMVVTTVTPKNLEVCNSDTLSVTILNTGSVTLSNISLSINLPLGVGYLANSVLGANQLNINDLQKPIFMVLDLAVGEIAQVSIQVKANCSLSDAINAGQLFVYDVSASTGNIIEQVSSAQFKIETGLLLVDNVTPNLLVGSAPQVLVRTIKIKNTRLGRIQNIKLKDNANLLGYVLTIDGLQDTDPSPFVFDAQVSTAFLQQVGNLDAWLDQDEEIVFKQNIAIQDCRDTAFEIKSSIKITWGCDTSACLIDAQEAYVRIVPATPAVLEIKGKLLPFASNCAEIPTWQYLNIKNTGNSTALGSVVGIDGIIGSIAIDKDRVEREQNGAWVPVMISSEIPSAVFSCTTKPLSHQVLVSVGDVAPQEIIRLRFAAYGCTTNTCYNVKDSLPINYFYRRVCPINTGVSERAYILFDSLDFKLDFRPIHDLPACVIPDSQLSLEYELKSKLLMTHQGFVQIKLEIPFGLMLDTVNCLPSLTNNGLVATQIQFVSPTANSTGSASFLFPTPLPFDSLRISYCLDYQCEENMICENLVPFPPTGGMIPAFVDSTMNSMFCAAACGLRILSSASLQYDSTKLLNCPFIGCTQYDIVVLDTCNNKQGPLSSFWPASMSGTHHVYRINYDYEDIDNDRVADSQARAKGPNIASNRFMLGDSLRLDLRGAVVAAQASVDSFEFKTFFETLTSDFGVQGADSFRVDLSGPEFCAQSHISYLGGTMFIKRTNGDIDSCTLGYKTITDQHLVEVSQANITPIEKVEYLASMDYLITPNFTKCGGALRTGDSCILLLDWVLKQNIIPAINDTMRSLRLMNFRVIPDHASLQYTYRKPNPPHLCQYSGVISRSGSPQYTIRACEKSLQVKPWTYRITLARENMFPYEVRPLTRYLKYDFNVPTGVEVLNVRLKELAFNNNVPILPITSFPLTQPQGQIDFTQVFPKDIDEGYKFEIDFEFGPSCTFLDAINLESTILRWTKPYLSNSAFDTIRMIAIPGYYSAVPRIKMTLGDTVLYTPSRTAQWTADLKNLTSPLATNVWASLSAESGSFTNAQISQNGQILTQIGGLFQLPNLGAFASQPLSISLTKTSCEPLIINLIYGWNCDPVTSLSANLCNRDTVQIIIQSLDPELELDIINQPNIVNLCDTTDWFTVNIYNANLGNAYDLFYSVLLPDGLIYEPGTAQIAYPDGANFLSTTDPVSLPNNQYSWRVNDLLTALNDGLPAVNKSPLNALQIRFRARTLCGFVSNTQPVYTTSANRACGTNATLLRNPGQFIQLAGIDSTDITQINITPTSSNPVKCGDEITLNIAVTVSSPPGTKDSIYLKIPNGFSYVLGSYVPGQNAPIGMPNTTTGWQIPLPNTLLPNAVLRFSIKLKYNQPQGCTDGTVTVQTRKSITAFCAQINANCAVYVANGEGQYTVPLMGNEISVQQISLLVDNNAKYTILGQITNQSNTTTGSLTVRFALDQNQNGSFDSGDLVIGQTPIIPIAGLSNYNFSALLQSLKPEDICKLLIYIDANEGCLCAPINLPINQITIRTPQITACELKTIDFGINTQPNHTYTWTPSTNLSCTNCAMPTFSPPAGTTNGNAFGFVLTDQSGSCQVKYTFDLSYFGAPVIQSNDQVICKGETVNLSVLPANATNIQWSGPGITLPNLAQQAVSPESTSSYIVTATLGAGCIGKDTIIITLLNKDSSALQPIVLCSGQFVTFYGDTLRNSGFYLKKFTNINGCDSLIGQQINILSANTNSQIAICEGSVTIIGDTIVKLPGVYCRTLKNALGCDSTHCTTVTFAPPISIIGFDTLVTTTDTIMLTAPSGYASYFWTGNVSCDTCQVTTLLGRDSVELVKLTVTNASGCTDTATYRVNIAPPCDADRLLIPDAFSPNNDQENEVFLIPKQRGIEVVQSLKIFNRWGQKVVDVTGKLSSWDGKVSGSDAPIETYYYIWEIGCPSGTETRAGQVTLLR
jgi:gliding motility-associated-like protein